jgi:hypothetical protein
MAFSSSASLGNQNTEAKLAHASRTASRARMRRYTSSEDCVAVLAGILASHQGYRAHENPAPGTTDQTLVLEMAAYKYKNHFNPVLFLTAPTPRLCWRKQK